METVWGDRSKELCSQKCSWRWCRLPWKSGATAVWHTRDRVSITDPFLTHRPLLLQALGGISNRGNPLLLEQECALQLVATSCPSHLSEQACPSQLLPLLPLTWVWASLVAQMVKNPPAMWETWVWSLGWKDPLEEGMAAHSSILAWKIPTDRGAWWAMVHGVAERDMTEWYHSTAPGHGTDTWGHTQRWGWNHSRAPGAVHLRQRNWNLSTQLHSQYAKTPWLAWYEKWKWKSPSHVRLMPEYWSGYPFLSPGDLPNPGIKPRSPALQQILYKLSHKGSSRLLEWVAYPFSSGSSWPRDWSGVSCIAGGFFTNWAVREACLVYPMPVEHLNG